MPQPAARTTARDFAGSGVGKSTLLGMIARNSSADVNVIGLIGERGREVKDFLKGFRPGGSSPLGGCCGHFRPAGFGQNQGAYTATAIAEYFGMPGPMSC